MSPTEGAFSSGSSGSANAGTSSRVRAPRAPRRRSAGSARLATIAKQRAEVGVELGHGDVGHACAAPRGCWPCALRTSSTGAPQVGRDPGVEGELRRRADVGVVAAHHHHGVRLARPPGGSAPRCCPSAASGSSVQVGVGDAGALVVRQRHGVVRDQQVEHVVGRRVARARPGGRPRPARPAWTAARGPRGPRSTCRCSPRRLRRTRSWPCGDTNEALAGAAGRPTPVSGVPSPRPA